LRREMQLNEVSWQFAECRPQKSVVGVQLASKDRVLHARK
jgi:hypothetical protein